VAAIFGWSKPELQTPPVRVKNEPFQNGANTIGFDTTKKIALDPKQELSVDPSALAINDDQMALSAIYQRPSYFTSFAWSPEDQPLVTSLFKCAVNPAVITRYIYLAQIFKQPTALAYAAAPFQYWRGSITYRFEVVCSKFHRGKVMVLFEPNISQSTLIDAAISLNKQYSKVVDIQQLQDFELTVEWASPFSWLKVPTATDAQYVWENFSSLLTGFANGYINVTPFTKLQSNDDSSVYINAYVYSKHIEFNGLTTTNLPTQRNFVVAQSMEIETQAMEEMPLNVSSASMDHISEHYFGETPKSFRALLKRYVTENIYIHNALSSTIWGARFDAPIYPPIQRKYDAIKDSDATTTLYDYLRYAYMGMKGGVKYRLKLRERNTASFAPYNQIKITLNPPTNNFTTFTWTASYTSTDVLGQIADLLGTVTFVPDTNGGVEFELPFYSNNTFLFSFNKDLVSDTSGEMEAVFFRNFHIFYDRLGTSSGTDIALFLEMAIGEDFSFMRFQGAPFYT